MAKFANSILHPKMLYTIKLCKNIKLYFSNEIKGQKSSKNYYLNFCHMQLEIGKFTFKIFSMFVGALNLG